MRVLLAIPKAARRQELDRALLAADCDPVREADTRRAYALLTSEVFDVLILQASSTGAPALLTLLHDAPPACPPCVLLLSDAPSNLADCTISAGASVRAIASLAVTLARKPFPLLSAATKKLRDPWIAETLDTLRLNGRGRAYIGWMLGALSVKPLLEQQLGMYLYPLCAQRFGTSGVAVERCVRAAVERCFSRAPLESLERFFGSTVDPERGKPTNRAFLMELSEQLRRATAQSIARQQLAADQSFAPIRSPNSSDMHQRPAAPTSV